MTLVDQLCLAAATSLYVLPADRWAALPLGVRCAAEGLYRLAQLYAPVGGPWAEVVMAHLSGWPPRWEASARSQPRAESRGRP